MHPGPEVYEWGPYIIARLARSAIVLDARSSTVFELAHTAAVALDVLSGRDALCIGPEVERIRRRAQESLGAIRDELLGKRAFAPGEGMTLTSGTGEPLLRRRAEPTQWRASLSRCKTSSPAGDLELSGGIVQIGHERVAVLAGQRPLTAELVRGFAMLEPSASLGGLIELALLGPQSSELRSPASGPEGVGQIWTLGSRATANVVLARLGHAASLLALLEATRSRPDAWDIHSLAVASATHPHFRANLPRGGLELAQILRRYGDR